jgi:hypothetical protein
MRQCLRSRQPSGNEHWRPTPIKEETPPPSDPPSKPIEKPWSEEKRQKSAQRSAPERLRLGLRQNAKPPRSFCSEGIHISALCGQLTMLLVTPLMRNSAGYANAVLSTTSGSACLRACPRSPLWRSAGRYCRRETTSSNSLARTSRHCRCRGTNPLRARVRAGARGLPRSRKRRGPAPLRSAPATERAISSSVTASSSTFAATTTGSSSP